MGVPTMKIKWMALAAMILALAGSAVAQGTGGRDTTDQGTDGTMGGDTTTGVHRSTSTEVYKSTSTDMHRSTSGARGYDQRGGTGGRPGGTGTGTGGTEDSRPERQGP